MPRKKGFKHSEETKRKIGLANSIALEGHKLSEDTKKKIAKGNKGKKVSEESKRKMRKPKSEEHKKNISKGRKGKFGGDKCPSWKGGISLESYSLDWTRTLKRAIRERDKYTCQICGKEPAIFVHHINYNKKDCNSNNLITLCRRCHTKTNYNRRYWMNYFYERNK